MQLHIANILIEILKKPQDMLGKNTVGAKMILEAIEIEADALAKVLGPKAIDDLAVSFVYDCRYIPTEGLYEDKDTKTDLGITVQHIDLIGKIIISRMGGNPWDSSKGLGSMTERLNRLHYGQLSMNATLRAALEHPGAPPMEHIQVAGTTRNTRSVDSIPMHWAVTSNNSHLARLWLEYGMDPNVRDGSKQSPMARAMSVDVVAALLGSGASLEDVDGAGTWAPDHWKKLNISDSARMQMMNRVVSHLLDGGGNIDKARAKSIVVNLPPVRKMQAAMDRSGVGWWEGDRDDTLGKSLCCQAAMVTDYPTGSSIKRLQSLMGAARSAEGADEADNPTLMALADARLAVAGGQISKNHIIQNAEPVPRVLGMVIEEDLNSTAYDLKSFKAICTTIKRTHQLLAEGLPVERSWLEPLSRVASVASTLNGVGGDGAQAFKGVNSLLINGWKLLDQDNQEDLLPLLVPLVFYSQDYSVWQYGSGSGALMETIMDTHCRYQERPEKQAELKTQITNFQKFAEGAGGAGSTSSFKEALRGVAASLDAKLMQASCVVAEPNAGTRSGPRF